MNTVPIWCGTGTADIGNGNVNVRHLREALVKKWVLVISQKLLAQS